jgi:hypothetical protein
MISKIFNRPVLIAIPIALFTFLTTKYLDEVYGWITGSSQLQGLERVVPYGTLLRTCLWLLAAVVVCLAFVYSKHREHKESSGQGKQQVVLYSPDKTIRSDAQDCSRPTPGEIYDQIWEQPPLLQTQFADNFKGIKVKWVGTFFNVSSQGGDIVNVGVSSDGHCFYFNASLKDYPILRTLKRDAARLQVSGTVKSATSAIELDDAHFIFLKEPK